MAGFVDGGYGFTVPPCYTNLVPVGRGAFGLVVKAHVVPGLTRPNNAYFERLELPLVAIKKLPATTAFKDCYHAKQVFREISLLKQLTHDNLIKLVDLFMCPNTNDLYIITEAMDCDLSTLINSEPGSSFELIEPHIKFITYQMLRGLNYMHSAGVLHRDLKPQNILVNKNLDVRICDLGLARVSAPRDGLSTGYVTTRWYRAPEVMLTWQHYTDALDMWSVGCILAEMLNRLNRAVTFVDPKTNAKYYAMFPADSHVEHLRMILQTLGMPPDNVLATISEPSIRDFVQSTIVELQPSMQFSFEQKLAHFDPLAVQLLSGLLHYDPTLRWNAQTAMAHEYLAQFRDVELEYTRSTINTSFEDLDLPVELWQTMIQTEITNMGVIDDGDGALDAAASTGLDPAPLMSQHSLDALAHDVQLPPELLMADARQMSLPVEISMGMAPDVAQRVQLEQDMLLMESTHLMEQLSLVSSDDAAHAQLMNAVGEIRSRLAMYQAQLSELGGQPKSV